MITGVDDTDYASLDYKNYTPIIEPLPPEDRVYPPLSRSSPLELKVHKVRLLNDNTQAEYRINGKYRVILPSERVRTLRIHDWKKKLYSLLFGALAPLIPATLLGSLLRRGWHMNALFGIINLGSFALLWTHRKLVQQLSYPLPNILTLTLGLSLSIWSHLVTRTSINRSTLPLTLFKGLAYTALGVLFRITFLTAQQLIAWSRLSPEIIAWHKPLPIFPLRLASIPFKTMLSHWRKGSFPVPPAQAVLDSATSREEIASLTKQGTLEERLEIVSVSPDSLWVQYRVDKAVLVTLPTETVRLRALISCVMITLLAHLFLGFLAFPSLRLPRALRLTLLGGASLQVFGQGSNLYQAIKSCSITSVAKQRREAYANPNRGLGSPWCTKRELLGTVLEASLKCVTAVQKRAWLSSLPPYWVMQDDPQKYLRQCSRYRIITKAKASQILYRMNQERDRRLASPHDAAEVQARYTQQLQTVTEQLNRALGKTSAYELSPHERIFELTQLKIRFELNREASL